MIQAASIIRVSISQITNTTYMSRKSLPKLMDKKRIQTKPQILICQHKEIMEGVVYYFPLTLRLRLFFQTKFWISKSHNPKSVRPTCLILLPAPEVVGAPLEISRECRAQLLPVLILKLFWTGLLECWCYLYAGMNHPIWFSLQLSMKKCGHSALVDLQSLLSVM